MVGVSHWEGEMTHRNQGGSQEDLRLVPRDARPDPNKPKPTIPTHRTNDSERRYRDEGKAGQTVVAPRNQLGEIVD